MDDAADNSCAILRENPSPAPQPEPALKREGLDRGQDSR